MIWVRNLPTCTNALHVHLLFNKLFTKIGRLNKACRFYVYLVLYMYVAVCHRVSFIPQWTKSLHHIFLSPACISTWPCGDSSMKDLYWFPYYSLSYLLATIVRFRLFCRCTVSTVKQCQVFLYKDQSVNTCSFPRSTSVEPHFKSFFLSLSFLWSMYWYPQSSKPFPVS